MKISKAVERGADRNPAGADDLRKGKRDERSPGTLAQCWPAERPPGHLVISRLQASLHVARFRRPPRWRWLGRAATAINLAWLSLVFAVGCVTVGRSIGHWVAEFRQAAEPEAAPPIQASAPVDDPINLSDARLPPGPLVVAGCLVGYRTLTPYAPGVICVPQTAPRALDLSGATWL